MFLGRWEDAWAASDAIVQRKGGAGDFWDGAPLTGKRVMLRCLHGFGDALQLIRYAPMLRAEARSLCVETHGQMVPLLRACDGVDEVITWDAPPPEPPVWDAQIEIMELPWMFRSTPETVPARFPYLHAAQLPGDPAFAERVHGRGRLQYGFSWRSSNWNPLRSVPFAQLAAALDGLDADGYSLQQDGAAELAGTRFENIEDEFPTLASRMAELDCVLTVDGVLAHLAGALGLPVLLLLPYAADWRWGLGERTPWYPGTQLFRQQTPGDWRVPLQRAMEALRKLGA